MSWLKDTYAAAIGRPRAIEGEQMVVSNGLMASMTRPAGGGVYFLPVDEIIRRKGWSVYKDMLHDEQVKACLAFKRILIHGRTWELKPAFTLPEPPKFVPKPPPPAPVVAARRPPKEARRRADRCEAEPLRQAAARWDGAREDAGWLRVCAAVAGRSGQARSGERDRELRANGTWRRSTSTM
jgi:hypothetical protein